MLHCYVGHEPSWFEQSQFHQQDLVLHSGLLEANLDRWDKNSAGVCGRCKPLAVLGKLSREDQREKPCNLKFGLMEITFFLAGRSNVNAIQVSLDISNDSNKIHSIGKMPILTDKSLARLTGHGDKHS